MSDPTPGSDTNAPREQAPLTRSRSRVVVKIVIAAAAVLPLVSLGMCSGAVEPSAEGDTVLWTLLWFGLSLVAGFVVFIFVLAGKERRLSAIALGVNAAGVIANVAYALTHISYTRGRQLRGPTGRILPTRRQASELGDAVASAARAWRHNGDTEAASVSAFSMLSLDLAQLGAPLELVRAAHEDALDEIRHAELCYGLARKLGDTGAAVAPMTGLGAIRSRPCTLAAVAVESWVEGAYLETVSAEIAKTVVDGVSDDAIRAALRTIAVDEAKHAAHAWEVVQWCIGRDRGAVAGALRALLQQDASAPDPGDEDAGADGSLGHVGIPGREMQRTIAARCLIESKDRLRRLLS